MTRGALAWYLGGAAAAQVLLYAAWALLRYDSMFYFDPRIGLFMLQTFFLPPFFEAPGPLSWLSAAWLGYVAFKVPQEPGWVSIYRRSEIILALPTLLFAALVPFMNISPAHGFSVLELFVPFIVFVPFSVVPYVLAKGLPSTPSGARSSNNALHRTSASRRSPAR